MTTRDDDGAAADLIRSLPARSRALASLIERLRTGRGAYALHETGAAARPALLASLYRAIGGQILVIVPTPDVAERAFADLLYYLGEPEPQSIALLRSRDETVGAIESPSERSARMTLLADLADGKPGIAIVPLAALRQYVMPKAVFQELRFTLRTGEEAGWDRTQERLYALGYRRSDVVSAAGEYAVRGGILDVFPASAASAVRIEFFGDGVESIRAFDLQSQRSRAESDGGALAAVDIVPWSEIPRGEPYRQRVIDRYDGPEHVAAALRAYLEGGAEVPEPWLSLAYDRRETVLEYLDARALVVFDEPSMLATVESALDDERSREESVLLAGLRQAAPETGARPDALSVSEREVGELLLAEVAAPYPRLRDLAPAFARYVSLAFPGGIESAEPLEWLPAPAAAFVLQTAPVEHFNRQIAMFVQSVRAWAEAGETIVLVSSGVARTSELLRASGIPLRGVVLDHGNIESGFAIPDLHLRVLGDREIYGQPPKRVKIRAIKEGVPVTLADLRVGDYVVHAVHGIGRYLGLRTETILGATQDYLDLRYAGTDRMLVPVTQMHQVQKYSASEGGTPRLSKMGGADWARAKGRVAESVAKIADGLVLLYAERELARGHAFAPDTPWQSELEEAFPYEETPDQMKAILETKADMERARPMDRLVCGDVGYGKTEVAIRAAFKAVADKKQVAVLVPTTLLANQHYRTFSSRFAGFPMRIEEISRSKSRQEQRAILQALAEGKIDIVVGTHRLLQKDVAFADLGLIVVDEEQRFGVMHKERLKQYKASVDVLTLSATPIPRTLHMSLVGLRDMSVIETPPKDRMAIQTVVARFDEKLIRSAIEVELERGGQVYFVHNRVESIYEIAVRIQELVPAARVVVAHGQMGEGELEKVMLAFMHHEFDVLVATTIIENGLDIPLANTILINRAERHGLSELYQLRGRVGRSNRRAYAYLLIPPENELTEVARRRLAALKEFSDLGAGFKIAALDLELRGAGNMLGGEQSGHIEAVGFELYTSMLEAAVKELKGEGHEERPATQLNLGIALRIDESYVPEENQRLRLYKKVAGAASEAALQEVRAEMGDRYGALPDATVYLLEAAELRLECERMGVAQIDRKRGELQIRFSENATVDPAQLMQLVARNARRGAQFTPQGVLKLPLKASRPDEVLLEIREVLASLAPTPANV